MPFEASDGRDFDKDPVAWGKVEIVRPFDDQIGHFGWQDNTGDDRGLALAHPRGHEAVGDFQEEQYAGRNEPLPELGGVHDQEAPIGHIEQMSKVEDFKVAASTDKG